MKANVFGVFGFSAVIRRINVLQHHTRCKYFVSGSTARREKFEDGRMITDAIRSRGCCKTSKGDSGVVTHLQSNKFLRGSGIVNFVRMLGKKLTDQNRLSF